MYDALDHEVARARLARDMDLVPSTHPDADLESAMLPDILSEGKRIDHEMEQRGGLLRAIEPAPIERDRTPERFWMPASIAVAILVAALVINAFVGN